MRTPDEANIGRPWLAMLAASMILAGTAAGAGVGGTARVDLSRHAPAAGIDLARLADDTFEWSLPDGIGKQIQIPLAPLGIDPAAYDEIRFDLMPIGSQVALHTLLTHHPAKGQVSSWYAKFPQRPEAWTEARFDLRVDDDGALLPADPNPDPALRLSLGSRRIGFPGEPDWRKARIRNLRFVRHHVSLAFDLAGATVVSDASEIAYVYTLTVTNRTAAALTARLDADSERTLRYFTVEAPAEIDLGPGEAARVPVRVWLSRTRGLTLPPLYAEPLLPKVWIEGVADSDVVPLMGYRTWPMWAAVPAFNRRPLDPEAMRAAVAAWETIRPGANAWMEDVIRRAEGNLNLAWPLPPLRLYPNGFDQSYRCNACGTWLRQAEHGSFDRHICPSCKKVTEDDEAMSRHGAAVYVGGYAGAVHALALGYAVSGREEFAYKAFGMLLAYARLYPEIAVSGQRSTAGGSRLRFSTLHGSYTLPGLAEGYAWIRSAPGLDEGERERVEGFLREEALRIARHGSEYNNQSAEHFRAYGAVGLATGYWPLAALAIHGPFNWHDMIEYGFDEDGFNSEGGAYHRSIFYAMNAFALFATQYDVPLLSPRFRRVFDASLTMGLAGPDYELAYRAYRDPAYLPPLFGVRSGAFNEYTLHAGVPGLPDVSGIPVRSELKENSGYVFLRRGSAVDFRETRLNYIKQFERSEQDRLSTMFFRNQRPIDTHVGRIAYSVPDSWWMTHTAAQNTIVIDGGSQREVPCRLVAFDPAPEAPVAVVATDAETPLYPGVRQVRGIALIGDAYVVFDRIDAENPRTVDRYQYGPGSGPALHPEGGPVEMLPALPEIGRFKGIEGGAAGREARVDFGGGLRMRLVSDRDLALYRAVTFGGYQGQPLAVTFARASGVREVTFLAALVEGKDAEPPTLRIAESTPEHMVLEVESEGVVQVVHVDVAGKTARVRAK